MHVVESLLSDGVVYGFVFSMVSVYVGSPVRQSVVVGGGVYRLLEYDSHVRLLSSAPPLSRTPQMPVNMNIKLAPIEQQIFDTILAAVKRVHMHLLYCGVDA